VNEVKIGLNTGRRYLVFFNYHIKVSLSKMRYSHIFYHREHPRDAWRSPPPVTVESYIKNLSLGRERARVRRGNFPPLCL